MSPYSLVHALAKSGDVALDGVASSHKVIQEEGAWPLAGDPVSMLKAIWYEFSATDCGRWKCPAYCRQVMLGAKMTTAAVCLSVGIPTLGSLQDVL